MSNLERKEPLSQIVQAGVQTHPHQHSHVFLHIDCLSRQQMQHQRLCQAVAQQIAHGHIDGELPDLRPFPCLILKRKVFVQEETDDAADHIIGRRGDPIGAVGHVVQQKHGSAAHKRIDHTNSQKFDYGLIKRLCLHGNPRWSPLRCKWGGA